MIVSILYIKEIIVRLETNDDLFNMQHVQLSERCMLKILQYITHSIVRTLCVKEITTLKRDSLKRESPKRDSLKRNSPKRDSPKRDSPKRDSLKRVSSKETL